MSLFVKFTILQLHALARTVADKFINQLPLGARVL
jgi:hypothetical protein